MVSCSAGPWHRSARHEIGQPRKHVLGVVGQYSTVWEWSLEAVRRPWPNQRRQMCLRIVSWLCAFGAQAVMATTASAQNLTVSASVPLPLIQGLLPKQSVNNFSCGLFFLTENPLWVPPAPPTGTVGVHLDVHSRTLSDRFRCDSASAHCSTPTFGAMSSP